MITVQHKGTTFTVTSTLLHRIQWPGGSCDVIGPPITALVPGKKCIAVECGVERYKFVWNGVRDWMLMDVTPQSITKLKGEE